MGLFRKKAEESIKQATGKGGLISYAWILRHFVFLLFLASLAIIYIANGHWADNTIRDINITTKQVKEMEYEYKNLKSLEMYRSRESQVREAAQRVVD